MLWHRQNKLYDITKITLPSSSFQNIVLHWINVTDFHKCNSEFPLVSYVILSRIIPPWRRYVIDILKTLKIRVLRPIYSAKTKSLPRLAMAWLLTFLWHRYWMCVIIGILISSRNVPVNSPHKGQWRGKRFHLMTSSWVKYKPSWVHWRCLTNIWIIVNWTLGIICGDICTKIQPISFTKMNFKIPSTKW